MRIYSFKKKLVGQQNISLGEALSGALGLNDLWALSNLIGESGDLSSKLLKIEHKAGLICSEIQGTPLTLKLFLLPLLSKTSICLFMYFRCCARVSAMCSSLVIALYVCVPAFSLAAICSVSINMSDFKISSSCRERVFDICSYLCHVKQSRSVDGLAE